MSKIPKDILDRAIHDILTNRKERQFLETVELQIGIKNIDANRDNVRKYTGTVRLPHIINPKREVCVLGAEVHCEQARDNNIPYLNVTQMEAFNKNAKLVKKTMKKYSALAASASLISMIPKYFGPTLNRLGKFPYTLGPADKVTDKVIDIKSSIKFQLKKNLCLGIPVGNVGMTEEMLRENIVMAVNFIASKMKKNWENIGCLVVKSTMGKPQRIYG